MINITIYINIQTEGPSLLTVYPIYSWRVLAGGIGDQGTGQRGSRATWGSALKLF